VNDFKMIHEKKGECQTKAFPSEKYQPKKQRRKIVGEK